MNSAATRPVPPRVARPPLAVAALWLALALGAVFVGAVAAQVVAGPVLPGRLQADALTTYVAALADFVTRTAAIVTLGCFAGIAFFTRPDADDLTPAGRRYARIAARTGQVWLWGAVLLTCANPAFVNGYPLEYTLRPQSWWDFVSASPSGLAWLLSALVAAGCVAVGYTARRVAAPALALGTGLLSLIFVGVTGSVTVGLNHDWSTDAAIWLVLATVPLLTGCVAVLLARAPHALPDAAEQRRVRRYHRLVPWLLVIAAVGVAVVAWQQLAGTSPLASLYGTVVLGLGGVLVAWALSWLVRAVRGRYTWSSVARDGLLAVAWLALTAAETHVPSPRFVVPQSIQVNYLGYVVPAAVDAARLLGPGRPNWLWIGLTVFALLTYFLAVLRLRRRGGHWPIGRSIAWSAGWLLTLYLATSGFWEYSTVVYSWHMFVHMTVNMLTPVLCVLGGPFTLIEQASLDRSRDLPGPREVVAAIQRHRPFAKVFSPPVLWLNYVASLFVVYFTPLFPWLMRYHWAHQLMLLYFMVTGYLFFNLIVGVDKQLHDLPHLIRLAMVVSIMPFHAMFAVGIMSSQSLFGADFYRTIEVPWVRDLMADQNIAGQITWILGEVPLFIVMISLAAQWFAHDKVENARYDAAAETGADTSFDAYNDMLAELAQRDRDQQVKRYL